MKRAAHARWLEYLEKWEYFGRAAQTRLDREQWSELDEELTPLLPKIKADACTAEELARARLLRRVLLVD